MSLTNPKPSVMKQAAMQITAGGSAGFIEVCLMHPLDVVKTRLQLQIKKPIAGGNTVRIFEYMEEVLFPHKAFFNHSGLLQWSIRLLFKNCQTGGYTGCLQRDYTTDSS